MLLFHWLQMLHINMWNMLIPSKDLQTDPEKISIWQLHIGSMPPWYWSDIFMSDWSLININLKVFAILIGAGWECYSFYRHLKAQQSNNACFVSCIVSIIWPHDAINQPLLNTPGAIFISTFSWWCPDMKMLSVLLTLCEGNPLVTDIYLFHNDIIT